MPGTALNTAPAKNALIPNFEASNPMQQNITKPQTRRPIIIAQTKDTYTHSFRLGNLRCSHPAAKPYAASSNAIQNAVGNIGGIPNSPERKSGATRPTKSPHGAPQKNPHSNTGICIGQSIAPICGICPVKNGMTNANAKNIADKVSFLTSFLLFMLKFPFRRQKEHTPQPLSIGKNGFPSPPSRGITERFNGEFPSRIVEDLPGHNRGNVFLIVFLLYHTFLFASIPDETAGVGYIRSKRKTGIRFPPLHAVPLCDMLSGSFFAKECPIFE